MQRALILDGRRAEQTGADDVDGLLDAELSAAGYMVERLVLRELELAHCIGCFECWVKTPGECVVDDGARRVARSVIASDLVVLLTPVTFGGYSYELKKAMDRIICLVSPFFTRIDGEVHHEPRYARYPRVLGVGLQPEANPEASEIFSDLVTRNAINLHSPGHAAMVVSSRFSSDLLRPELRSRLERLGAADG